ncbi:MAG: hypothetical protein ACJ8AW_14255 [Rhodopila sp.]
MSESGITKTALSFFDLYDRDAVAADAIDDWIGRWHEQADPAAVGREIHDYLGLTLPEYQVWVYDPDVLPYLRAARRAGRTLDAVVRERLAALIEEGTMSDETTIEGLRVWLDGAEARRTMA